MNKLLRAIHTESNLQWCGNWSPQKVNDMWRLQAMTGEASVFRVELFSASRRVTGMTPNEIEQYYWLEDDRVVNTLENCLVWTLLQYYVPIKSSVCIYSALKASDLHSIIFRLKFENILRFTLNFWNRYRFFELSNTCSKIKICLKCCLLKSSIKQMGEEEQFFKTFTSHSQICKTAKGSLKKDRKIA